MDASGERLLDEIGHWMEVPGHARDQVIASSNDIRPPQLIVFFMYPPGPTEAGPAFLLVLAHLSSQSSDFLEQTMSQNLRPLLGPEFNYDVS
jgi:hypothetical protein